MEHIPILYHEILEALAIKPDGLYVDCTFGRGGHSTGILQRLTTGRLIAIDQDDTAIEAAHQFQKQYAQLVVVKDNFRHLKTILSNLNIDSVDGILIDLGVSSPQFDDPSRGFSYRSDATLDMRMDQSQELTAKTIVNSYSFEDLRYIFQAYGEETYAKQIARKIEAARKLVPIETTGQLVEVIKSALPTKVLNQKGHPAKQVFQALRIAVNDELGSLDEILDQAIDALKSGGRLAILSFHSLEDRKVKQAYVKRTKVEVPGNLPLKDLPTTNFELYSRQAIVASAQELQTNPRSHSAKLRVLIRK